MSTFLRICSLLVFVALSACGTPATHESSTAIPTTLEASIPPASSPTSSPVPLLPSDTPIPPTVTNTPLPPTLTNTPAPASLNASGPYVIFFGHGGVWITNPDGTFPTRLFEIDISHDLDWRRTISPKGDRMALVVGTDQGYDLVLVTIPGGESEVITQLISRPTAGSYSPVSENSFATYAIRDYDSIAWQPGEGRLLAFIGAINGPTADLYLYDTQTKEISQLTSGPSQAVLPAWSPDGQYILHFGVSWVPPFGGAIGDANHLDGVWAVQVSDGKIISLPKQLGSRPHFLGWQDDTSYITYDSGECEAENLRSVDIVTGNATQLLPASFYNYLARSPVNGAILFSSAAGCPKSLGEGIFLLPHGESTPTRLLDKKAWEVDWMPESNVFDAYPEALFSADGQIRYEPPLYSSSFHPAISRLGYQAWNVIQNQLGAVQVRVPGREWQTILTGRISQLIWDPLRGDTLLIAMEDGTLYVASYPDFKPQQRGSMGGSFITTFWIP